MAYEFHPIAGLFPLMDEEALNELADDIRAHGLNHAITLYEGKILDGRNRYLACPLAGIEPRFETWRDTGSPTAWVISENLKRRHLNTSQRAAVAADARPLFEAEARERQRLGAMTTHQKLGRGDEMLSVDLRKASPSHSTVEAAKLMNVGESSVERASRVKREAPELFEKIRTGEVSVNAAYDRVRERAAPVKPIRKQFTTPPVAAPTTNARDRASDERVRELLAKLGDELIFRYAQRHPGLLFEDWVKITNELIAETSAMLSPYRIVKKSEDR